MVSVPVLSRLASSKKHYYYYYYYPLQRNRKIFLSSNMGFVFLYNSLSFMIIHSIRFPPLREYTETLLHAGRVSAGTWRFVPWKFMFQRKRYAGHFISLSPREIYFLLAEKLAFAIRWALYRRRIMALELFNCENAILETESSIHLITFFLDLTYAWVAIQRDLPGHVAPYIIFKQS